jgi:hypothetical protein
MAAFEPVNGVQAAAPTTGLVASALTPNDDARWQDGIAWRSERCPTAQGFDPCGETFETPAVGAGGDAIHYYRPVAFRVYDECSTRIRDYDQERARRQASAVTSWMVARELEQGTISRANPYDTPPYADETPSTVNHFLAEATGGQIVTGGAHLPLVALGLLEEAARDGQLGMDPFLHVSPRLLPLLRDGIEREGNLLRTPTGARVVVDAGYTGTGPLAGGTAEVQTVTITGTPTGGSFTLTYAGQTTASIAFDANAAAVQAALLALPNLGTGDVVVGGGPGPGTPYTVTFALSLGNPAQMTAAHTFTGGTAPNIAVTTTTPYVAQAATAGDWMYATGPVQVRLAPINVLPDILWIRNVQSVIAERLFAATFDPCTLRAVQVDVPEPAA